MRKPTEVPSDRAHATKLCSSTANEYTLYLQAEVRPKKRPKIAEGFVLLQGLL